MSDVAPWGVEFANLSSEIKKLLQEHHQELCKSLEAWLHHELTVTKVLDHSSAGTQNPTLPIYRSGGTPSSRGITFGGPPPHIDTCFTPEASMASKALQNKHCPSTTPANFVTKSISNTTLASKRTDCALDYPLQSPAGGAQFALDPQQFLTPNSFASTHRFQALRQRHGAARLSADRRNPSIRSHADSAATPKSTRSNISTKSASKKPIKPWQWANFEMQERKLDQGRKEAAKALGKSGSFVDLSSELPRSRLQKLVDDPWFETLFSVAIASNSIFIGAQVEYAASNLTVSTPTIFFVLNIFYATMFIIELALRMCAAGCDFFRPGRMFIWNYIDFFSVAVSVFEIVAEAITNHTGTIISRTGSSNMRIIRILRVIRFLRILRISRMLRFIHALRTFVYSIMATLRTLFWALTLLVLILYVFAIVFTQAVSDYSIADASQTSMESKTLLKYWGSLPNSMFTLFKAVSGGVSWHDVVYPLHVVGWLWVAIFVIFVAFTYFAVLNVVTGIFCESAIHTARNDEELLVQDRMNNRDIFVRRIRNLFKELHDDEESPILTIVELEKKIDDPEVQAVFESLHVDASDAWALFKLLDVNEKNALEIDEFVVGLMRLKGEARRSDVLELDAKLGAVLRGLGHINGAMAEMLAGVISLRNSSLGLQAEHMRAANVASNTPNSANGESRSTVVL